MDTARFAKSHGFEEDYDRPNAYHYREEHPLYLENAMSSAIRFLGEFSRSPAFTGAVAPSSRYLASTIIDEVGLESASVVVEFGPGTGSFTEAILERLHPDASFVAIEVNAELVSILREKFPDIDIIESSVEQFPEILESRGHAEVDVIISGLPWASFDSALQMRIMFLVKRMLRDGGVFTTFAYLHGFILPAAWRFRRLLDSSFTDVSFSKPVWLNLPPAFCYRCTK